MAYKILAKVVWLGCAGALNGFTKMYYSMCYHVRTKMIILNICVLIISIKTHPTESFSRTVGTPLKDKCAISD